MKFDEICENIAVKILGTPGLFVECMNNELVEDFLEKGELYEVVGSSKGAFSSLLSLACNERELRFNPRRFRL